MNVAVTDGLQLMPPPFSADLGLWSREDGTPGSASYAGQPNAAFVPADQDFAGCLELQKTATTQRLRSYAQTPILPGVYLRITARVKAISGNLPTVRIAAYAARANGTNVGSVLQTGPAVSLTSYGQVVTVTAIVGTGGRTGVNMVWGLTPVYGHFGLDLTGPNGGVVRIDDIVIEDVSSFFQRKLMDWVDVRDFGAVGDGVTDDAGAFIAADAAAAGRSVLVSAGTYFLNSNTTFNTKVRFEGKVVMPANRRLVCTRDYNMDTYEAAFGSEPEGFRRALQALFYFTDHVTLDLGGRRVQLTEPVDVAAVAGLDTLAQRRVLANGQLEAQPGSGWNTTTVTSVATYTPASNATLLTAVANVAGIPVGARVSGTGVGREVYVRSKNVGAGTVELSRPLWGAAGTRTLTFTRYRYMLDFSGFASLSRFEIIDMEFQCGGLASAVMIPPAGSTFRVADSVINRPKDRALTSIGTGCQGMFVDQCQFLSDEQPLPAQDRTTICLNVNANDAKIRDNRIVRFAHFAILSGSGNVLTGNHFFQGDDQALGVRRAGVVFASTNVKSTMTANYIDNCFIEWSNEHDAVPAFASGFSFGGLTLTGNIFTVNDVAPSFRWIVVSPYGSGHFINGFMVNDNVFRTVNTNVDRVDGVDTTLATLDFTRFRNILFEANTFNGVNQITQSPVVVRHTQNTAANTWVIDGSAILPFGSRARNVTAVVADGQITTAANAGNSEMPWTLSEQGPGGAQVHLRWSTALKGKANVTIRCDNPN
ncbi:MAG: right-handed parallel beta-helix repeat-containing protein [Paracoccaceae bacterium]|nr:MAG: right-handed parallel beta-helix repeat-containing protein [Paracoccaceae bacterium]